MSQYVQAFIDVIENEIYRITISNQNNELQVFLIKHRVTK